MRPKHDPDPLTAPIRTWPQVVAELERRTGIKLHRTNAERIHREALKKIRPLLEELARER
jgi:hypothetical protein